MASGESFWYGSGNIILISAQSRRVTARLCFVIALIASGCSILPYPPPQPKVYSLAPAISGELAEAYAKVTNRFGSGQTGFMLLANNHEALNWRLALVDHATKSIDIQYFIWQADAVGSLLFDRLIRAADRGVRVRVLVDDLVLAAKDRDIAAISKHPNFDVKLFNPGRIRGSTVLGLGEFLLNFRQLNRRMHNKLFAVDNRMAIVGGRNIGNEYFGLSGKYNFRDLDVLVVGPVVEQEISHAFDDYWNAKVAYPGSAASRRATIDELRELQKENVDYINEHRELLSSYPLEPRDWSQELRQLPARMKSGEAHFLQDQPIKLDDQEYRLVDMLEYLAKPQHKELIVVTPYLIPVKGFLEDLAQLEAEGVKVKIITGSMASNNHTIAHSHYKKYRRRILATGAELYEFRAQPAADIRIVSDVPPVRAKFISLHVKALVGDRKRCFVGSLNLDPRAIEINTENGLYIQSDALCGKIAREFDALMDPDNSWHVYVDQNNYLNWNSTSGTVLIQPARSFWQRISDFFYRLLPIEKQL